VPLKVCLQIAWHLMPYQVEAPSWADTERYDIAATMPANTTDDQVLLMLQNLAIRRFQIQFHWDERSTPAYALTVGKAGPKLKHTEDESATPMFKPSRNGFEAKNHSVADLAGILMRWTDRPVVDLTGIAGSYDFHLEWTTGLGQAAGAVPEGAAIPAAKAVPDIGGDVLAALPSLGLKAVSRKLPVRYLVIDHAEKIPIEE
jgi:uncharacterized protein (TIGR03435 family)